jgi:hypothetical protein
MAGYALFVKVDDGWPLWRHKAGTAAVYTLGHSIFTFLYISGGSFHAWHADNAGTETGK